MSVLSPVDELRSQLSEAVSMPGLAPAERIATLRAIRDQLNTLLGQADSYIGDVELLREADYLTVAEALLQVRQNATIREALIERGQATEEQMDAAGYLSHAELDRLRDEGRLIEAAENLASFTVDGLRLGEAFNGDIIHFDPTLHPRDRSGKFRDVLGKIARAGTVRLPSGVEVKKHDNGGFTVHHPEGSEAHHDAGSAADAALGHHDGIVAAMQPAPGQGTIHLPPKGRRGGAVPKVLHTHPPDGVRPPVASVPAGTAAGSAPTEDAVPPVEAVKPDPVVKTGDVDEAIKALAEGKNVELTQPRQLSTLLSKLHDVVQDMNAKGEKAPDYDLCRVTVKGTSVFCAENKGVPRVLMPQLSGVPQPGSPSAARASVEGDNVDLTEDFVKHLERRGVKIESGEELAANLKATQRELQGVKVAGMMKGLEDGKMRERELLVSKDGYIVDGHHFWAAKVGQDFADNKPDMTMGVRTIDMPILDLLAEANGFMASQGLVSESAHAGSDPFGRAMPGDLKARLDAMISECEKGLPVKVPQGVAPPDQLQGASGGDLLFSEAAKRMESYRAVLDLGVGVSDDLKADALFIDSAQAFEDTKAAVLATPDQPHVIVAAMKGRETADRKVAAKYNGDYSRLTDVIRGTVLVASPQDIPHAVDVLRQNAQTNGWKFSMFENRMIADPSASNAPGPVESGYSDITILIQHESGVLGEVQVNTNDMWMAKEIGLGDGPPGHSLYEQERAIIQGAKIAGRDLNPDEESMVAQLRFRQKMLYLHAWETALGRKAGKG